MAGSGRGRRWKVLTIPENWLLWWVTRDLLTNLQAFFGTTSCTEHIKYFCWGEEIEDYPSGAYYLVEGVSFHVQIKSCSRASARGENTDKPERQECRLVFPY